MAASFQTSPTLCRRATWHRVSNQRKHKKCEYTLDLIWIYDSVTDRVCVLLSSDSLSRPRRTVFSRAVEACDLHWQDSHLQRIISSDHYMSPSYQREGESLLFNPQGLPLWLGEHTRTHTQCSLSRTRVCVCACKNMRVPLQLICPVSQFGVKICF